MKNLDDLKAVVETDLCLVGRVIRDIPDEYRPALQKLVSLEWAEGGLADEPAAAKMRSVGIRVSATTLRRHRQGFCTCT